MGLPKNLITGRAAKLPGVTGDYKQQPTGHDWETGFVRVWNTLPDAPKPERNHRFHETRKWTFDFAWPAAMVAVELEGGAPGGGRHQRRKGFRNDCEKYREATKLGWHILRYTGDELKERPVQIAEEVLRVVLKAEAGQ